MARKTCIIILAVIVLGYGGFNSIAQQEESLTSTVETVADESHKSDELPVQEQTGDGVEKPAETIDVAQEEVVPVAEAAEQTEEVLEQPEEAVVEKPAETIDVAQEEVAPVAEVAEPAQEISEQPEEVAETPVETDEVVQEEVAPVAEVAEPEEKPAEKSDQGEEEFEIKEIDTTGPTTAGNWLLKRIWWERAKDKFAKTREAVNQVADSPMKFYRLQNDLEKSVLDPFYREIGLEQGELKAVLNSFLEKLDQERDRVGELDLEERDLIFVLQSEKKRLEQLQTDLNAISDLDNKIDDSITLLLQQVNKSRSYENQAWQNFDAIAYELSDEKAQELYYGMDAQLKSIKDIDVYINNQFSTYFDNMLQSAKDQVDRIKDAIKILKEKGIDIKQQVEQAIEFEESDEELEEDMEESTKSKPQQGMFSWLWDWISGK